MSSTEDTQNTALSIEKLKKVKMCGAVTTADLHNKKVTLRATVLLASDMVNISKNHSPKAQAFIELLSGEHFDAYKHLMEELSGSNNISEELTFASTQEQFCRDVALALDNLFSELRNFSTSNKAISADSPMKQSQIAKLSIGNNIADFVEFQPGRKSTQELLDGLGWLVKTGLKAALKVKGSSFDTLSQVATIFKPLEDSLEQWSESNMESICENRSDSGLGQDINSSHLIHPIEKAPDSSFESSNEKEEAAHKTPGM